MLKPIKTLKKSQKGFTLIEIVIVLFIVVLMSGIAIAGLSSTQAGQNFENHFSEFESILRQTKRLASTSKTYTDYNDTDGDGSKTDKTLPANYGLKIDASNGKLTLFADLEPYYDSNNGTFVGQKIHYDSGIPGQGGDSDIKTITLPNNLVLGVKKADGTPISTGVNIFFSPISSEMNIENENQIFNPEQMRAFIFEIKEKDGPRCRQLFINKSAGNLELRYCDN